MGPKGKRDPESVAREIKRNTCRKFHSEEKIQIILEGLPRLRGRTARRPRPLIFRKFWKKKAGSHPPTRSRVLLRSTPDRSCLTTAWAITAVPMGLNPTKFYARKFS